MTTAATQATPVVWMDGLDIPLIRSLETMFYEPFPDDRQPVSKAVGDSLRRYGAGGLETRLGEAAPRSAATGALSVGTDLCGLKAAGRGGCQPFDDVAMEYINPATGGTALRTIGCWIQLIRPGVQTQAHLERAVPSIMFSPARLQCDRGTRFDWRQGVSSCRRGPGMSIRMRETVRQCCSPSRTPCSKPSGSIARRHM